MILFGILGYIISEVLILVWFAKTFGMINLFFAFLFALILGAGLIRARMASFRQLMQNPREAASASSDRLRHVLETMAIVLAGILLVLPGLISDAAGLLIVLPGLRGFWVRRAEARIRREIAKAGASPSGVMGGSFANGRWQVFSSSVWMNHAGARTAQDADFTSLSEDQPRDVSPHPANVPANVIDITPLVRHSSKKGPGAGEDSDPTHR